MINLVVGFPGAATAWCAEVLAAASARVGRAAVIHSIESLESIGPLALAAVEDDLVCVAHSVDGALARTLAERRRTCVLVSADPLEALRELIAQGVAPGQAFRMTMATCAAMTTLAETTETLTVSAADRRDSAGAAARIAQFCGLRGAAEAPLPPPPAAADPVETDPAMRRALASFPGGIMPRGEGAIRIDAALFTEGAAPFGPANLPIDVSGYPRMVFFGPYIALPTGDWNARLSIELSGGAGSGHYHADVTRQSGGEVGILAHVAFSAAPAGRQEIVMPFRIESPNALVEFRLQTTRAMFEGEVLLQGAEVQRR